MREREFIFLETGEDDRIINRIVLHVSQPDSFDFVGKPQLLPIGTCVQMPQKVDVNVSFSSQSLRTSLRLSD